MTTARLRLKVKVIGQGQWSIPSAYGRSNAVGLTSILNREVFSLKILSYPPHLKRRFAKLPCEILYVTTLYMERQSATGFVINDKSQCSVGCG